MRTLLFQHTKEEGPGTIQKWLSDRAHSFHIHKGFNGESIPSAENFDFLIVLGGPMNIDEESKHPFLRDEKKFLHSWLKLEKPMLGICLGGQMLAQALGAKVKPHHHREIGFHPVQRTNEKHPILNHWPQSLHVFQWHEDHFNLPSNCRQLLTNEIAPNQAFGVTENTIGLQFHPESTKEWIYENYKDFQDQLEPYVQNKTQCKELLPQHLDNMTTEFFKLLDNFTKEKK